MDIEEIVDNYNYNMDPAFDSFSPSSSDRCTGPNPFCNWPSPPPISIPARNPQISVTHRPSLRRSVSIGFDNNSSKTAASFSRRAQAPIDVNSNVSSISTQSANLSLPHTDSQLSRSHPLPTTLAIGQSPSLFFTVPATAEGAFGILDSPLVMRREDLKASPEKPLSPPLTLPMSTLALPEADGDFSSAHRDEAEQQSPQEGANGVYQAGLRKDTLSDENEETFSGLLQSEGMDLSKLSPLSPSWKSDMSVISENSALLGSSSLAAKRSRGSLAADRHRDRAQQPYGKRNRPAPYLSPASGYDDSPSPPWLPQGLGDVMVPINPEDAPSASASSSLQQDAGVLYMPTPLLTPQRIDTSASQPLSGSDSLPTGLSLDGPDIWSPGSSSISGSPSRDFDFSRPFLQPLDIPDPSYHTRPRVHHPPGSPNVFISSLFDDDYSMEVDYDKSSASAPSPTSMISPYEFDPYSPVSSNSSSSSYAEPLPPPSSPSISRLSLPDLDLIDHESHPSSPSRRSFASLPDLEMDDPPDITAASAEANISDPPPPSPGGSLLCLPGADMDEDLLPPPASNFKTPFPPPHTSSPSLLFIDDPRDVPLPRSPSPEDFDFDLNIVLDEESDPELTKLYNLRKKSLAAERAARHAEAQLLDAGSISLRAEATKEKNKNKQRSKEVGALLRLKLGDQVAYSPSMSISADGHPKGMIDCMPRLVARMIFRRHDTLRPLANRKSTSLNHNYVRSCLSRSTVADLGGADFR